METTSHGVTCVRFRMPSYVPPVHDEYTLSILHAVSDRLPVDRSERAELQGAYLWALRKGGKHSYAYTSTDTDCYNPK